MRGHLYRLFWKYWGCMLEKGPGSCPRMGLPLLIRKAEQGAGGQGAGRSLGSAPLRAGPSISLPAALNSENRRSPCALPSAVNQTSTFPGGPGPSAGAASRQEARR